MSSVHTDPRASHMRPGRPGEPDGRLRDMHDSDEARIGALMTRFLRLVSFKACVQPRYGELRALFSLHARLIRTKRGTTNHGSIDVRGAISTQLIRTEAGWRISPMAYDDERDA